MCRLGGTETAEAPKRYLGGTEAAGSPKRLAWRGREGTGGERLGGGAWAAEAVGLAGSIPEATGRIGLAGWVRGSRSRAVSRW